LTYLKNVVIKERVTKVKGQAEARRCVNYPYEAIEEALVNAVYHRSYELREPIEVRVNPDKIEILSYPGPDASIANDALNKKRIVARRYRNRRIGEFLKELGLAEGRATGIPKIYDALEQNGSPRPHIQTDEGRTHFLIELPVHPAFKAPVEAPVKAPVAEGVSLNNTERKILLLSEVRAVGRKELLVELGYSTLVGSVKLALGRLKGLHLLELTIPDKPNSRNQRYRITDKGRRVLGVVK
jgi:ATP-dependent DNA helicase RecG